MGGRSYKRRIMIVDPEFQHRFIRRTVMLAVLIVVASLSLLAISYYLNLDIQSVVIQPLPLAISEPAGGVEEPETILSILVPVVVVCVVITLVVTFLFGIVISHRMAGPLFRICEELKEMAKGNLSGEMHLRKKDDFKSLARSVNSLKTKWRHHVQDLSWIVHGLHSKDRTEQASALNRLEEVVSSFKID